MDHEKYLAEIGARGGRAMTPAKIRAVTNNLRRAWAANRKKRKASNHKTPANIGDSEPIVKSEEKDK